MDVKEIADKMNFADAFGTLMFGLHHTACIASGLKDLYEKASLSDDDVQNLGFMRVLLEAQGESILTIAKRISELCKEKDANTQTDKEADNAKQGD